MYKSIALTIAIAVSYAVPVVLSYNWAVQGDGKMYLFAPHAGIALAALLVYGRRALPGIFLGALVAHAVSNSSIQVLDVLVYTFTVATGSTLAFYLAALVMKRIAPRAPLWQSAADLVKGNLCIAVACVISAAVAVSARYITGQVSSGEIAVHFAGWWLVEFCSMLFFAPLVYLVIRFISRRSIALDWTRVVGPPILNALTGAAALSAFLLLWNQETDNLSAYLERGSALAASGLIQALEKSTHNLESIRALVYAHGQLDQDQFRRFVDAEMQAHLGSSWVQAVGWAPKVTDPASWSSPVDESGGHRRGIWQRNSAGEDVPVADRVEYFPVHFMQPLNETNKKAVAFDLASEPSRRSALLRARDSGLVSMVAPIALVQARTAEPGMLMAVPIYAPDLTLESTAARQANLSGFATGVYRIRDIFDNSVIEGDINVDLHLFDESLSADKQWFHSRMSMHHGDAGRILQQNTLESTQRGLHGSTRLNFADHTWLVVATPGPGLSTSLRTYLPWSVFFLLLLLGTAVSGIMVERSTARANSEREQRRTADALKRAQMANESKADFMVAASHDIKQPLYALAMLTDTLLMSSPAESAEPILKRLRDSIKQTSNHFDRLLDVGMFQDGIFGLDRVVVRLGELCQRIDLEIAPLCAEKGLAWRLTVDDAPVYTDPELLLRLLRNLLTNAVRYTAVGEIALTVSLVGDWVKFELSDSGSGIPLDEQASLREQLINPDIRERRRAGLGLGLAIAGTIAQALELEIDFESTPGQGTTFHFLVPRGRESKLS